MADEDLQELLRRAAADDPSAGIAAMQRLLGVGRLVAAHGAAAGRGGRADPRRPRAGEPRRLRGSLVGDKFARGKLTQAAVGRDGRTVYVAESERAILAWDAVTEDV